MSMTWAERKRELELGGHILASLSVHHFNLETDASRDRRLVYNESPVYPVFITLIEESDHVAFGEAKQRTGADFFISEEVFSDRPGKVAMYKRSRRHSAGFWDEFNRIRGMEAS